MRFIWMVAIAASIRFAGLLPARVEHGEFLVRYGTGVLQTPPDGEEVAFVWQPFSVSNELEIRRDVVSITDQPVVLNAMYYYNSPTSIYIQPRAGAIPSLQTDIGGSYQIQSRSTDIVLQGRQTLILTFSPRIRYPTFLKGRPSPTQ